MAKRKVQERLFVAIPVQEAVASFLASTHVKRLMPNTQTEYTSELGTFANWCAGQHVTLDQVNAKQVDLFLEHIRSTHKPHQVHRKEVSSYTLAGMTRVIKTFLNWCLDDEEYSKHVKADVVRRIKKPRVIKTIIETFTPVQIEALFAACAKEESDHLRLRDRAIIALLLDTGIRANELCTLTIANVDLSPGDAHIKILGKGNKWGEVGMGSECRKLMSQYLRKFREPTLEDEIRRGTQGKKLSDQQERRLKRNLQETTPFFMNRNGQSLTTNGLGRIVARLGEWANIEGVRCSPHTLRHTFAAMFMRNGGDIYTLSKLLRHSSVKVTEDYLKSIQQWEARKSSKSVLDNL